MQTKDLAKAKTFYNGLFDWKPEDIPGMGYTVIQVGTGTGGGMCKSSDISSQWLAYVLVEDIHVSTKKAQSLGATICEEVTEVPGMGWLSIMIDPTGAPLGLWQPQKEM